MTALVLDEALIEEIVQRRRRWGADKYDEVWEGMRVMTPVPNDEHQDLVILVGNVLFEVVQAAGLGRVRPGVNLSDREEGWEQNYRVPDVVAFLNDTGAKNCDTHWVGGPDFVVEITSPRDKTREKLPFYEKIGTRELLLVERSPWRLELYRFTDGGLAFCGQGDVDSAAALESSMLPLRFQLVKGHPRPQIEVARQDTEKRWRL